MRRTVSSLCLKCTLLAAGLLCGCRAMTEQSTVALLPPYRNGDSPQIEAKGDPFLDAESTNSPPASVVEFANDQPADALWD